MDIAGIFKKLKQAVTSFTQDSKAWREQVLKDNPPPDPASLHELDNLDKMEKDLNLHVQDPAPTGIQDLMDRFIRVDATLTAAKDLYAYLSGVSQSPEASTKEKKARQSLRDLAEVVKEIRPRLFTTIRSQSNLFLDTMDTLIGKTEKIEGVTFPPVTQEDFDLTRRLFERERFSLDDDGTIKKLIDSWETVIAFFVNTNKSTPNYPGANAVAIALAKAKAEAEFFTMHGLLEVLYDRLEANRRTGIDILSPII
jgi:hypothetical protein